MKTVSMTQHRIRISETSGCVEVTASDDDNVTVKLGAGPGGIIMSGSRFDIHRLIIEADKQLSRLIHPWG